jgi:hypothetical protein
MTQDGRDYFKRLGSRVAQLRRDRGWTQVRWADALSVEVDLLLGDESAKAHSKRGPVPTLARRMERISALPETQQKFVIQVIETVLAQQGC